jgi:cell division protein FtsW
LPNRFEERRRKLASQSYLDNTLIVIIFFLVAFGLVMVYATSSYSASQTSGGSTYYLRKQAYAAIAGTVGMFVAMIIPYHFWEKLSVLAYIVSAFLILLIIPFGRTVNGAKRWIYIGPVSVQPAEVAKLAIIIFLANLICKLGSSTKTRRGFMTVLLSALPLAGMLYIITKNLSSAIIVCGIAFVMLFVSTPDYKRYFLIVLFIVLVAAVVVMIAVKAPADGSMSFRLERIRAWRDPEAYSSGKGFQTMQALYAIGSGGIFGKGLGESSLIIKYLPEAQNDMIFSIICEDLGLLGAGAIMMMFVLLIWRCMVIADNASDLYGALLVVGVIAHISIQVILNIAVVTNTIPNTGISLPFISYGGSSLLCLLVEMGIVLSVSRGIRLKDL